MRFSITEEDDGGTVGWSLIWNWWKKNWVKVERVERSRKREVGGEGFVCV